MRTGGKSISLPFQVLITCSENITCIGTCIIEDVKVSVEILISANLVYCKFIKSQKLPDLISYEPFIFSQCALITLS